MEEKPESNSDDALTFLRDFKCISPIFPNDFNAVIRINNNCTLSDAFKKMIDSRIMSIPVVDSKTGKPLFIISLMDIVALLLKQFKESDFTESFWNTLSTLFINKSSKVANIPISDFEKHINYSLDPVFSVMEDQELLEAVRFMIERRAHRVLVFDSKFNISNMITQSRVVQFFEEIVQRIPKGQKTLNELNLGFKKVITVSDSQTAFRAFKIMIDSKVTALAVINNQGKLIGNISISDIKLIGSDLQSWNLLGLPVRDYLEKLIHSDNKIRGRLLAIVEHSDGLVVVKVKPTDTLAWAVRVINLYKVHRAYIVDDNSRPVGVIALHDILKELVCLPPSFVGQAS
jgi:CBS domain-containing protein